MPENKLLVGSISPRLSIFQSLAQLAPLPTLIFTVQEIFGYSNAPALSYLIALVIVLFSANTVVQMGKRFPHAGGYYAYVANGISKSTGIYTQFIYIFYQVINTAAAVIFGAWVLQILLKMFDISIRGFYFLPITLILIFVIPYFGIKISTWFYVVTAGIEISIVLIISLIMVVHPAATSNYIAPFIPTVGMSSFALSVIFSLFFFTGYGSIVTLAEETKNPRIAVPKMAVISILSIGALELLFIYASQINWGTNLTSTFAANSLFPTYVSARALMGIAGFIAVGIFAYVSLVKGNIAIQNAASRGLYALGRDQILPSIFSRVHPKYKSPSGAIIINELIAIIIIVSTYLIFYFVLHITTGITEYAAVYLIALLTVGYLLTHIFANISVPFYFTRKEKKSLSIVKHYLLPLISTVAIIYALILSFTGLSGYMLSLPVIVIIYLLVSLFFVIILRAKHPEIVTGAGDIILDLRETDHNGN
ncbi:MAG: APC family permease [Thermoplasmata archaeon]